MRSNNGRNHEQKNKKKRKKKKKPDSYLGLLLKTLSLDERIIQLGVRVADFFLHDKELETLSETRFRTMSLCQGRHYLRMITNESRIDALFFQKVAN